MQHLMKHLEKKLDGDYNSSSFFSKCFVRVQAVEIYSTTDTATVEENSR